LEINPKIKESVIESDMNEELKESEEWIYAKRALSNGVSKDKI